MREKEIRATKKHQYGLVGAHRKGRGYERQSLEKIDGERRERERLNKLANGPKTRSRKETEKEQRRWRVKVKEMDG